jgi:DNA (cytosine-5)-methyltransferase 1
MSFTIGSLFDGSGGFPLAASLCGGTPVWASEVEPYPIAVTKSRFPNMKHLGSVTDVKGDEVEPVDVITFGSPCQDLSVAGKRAGLKHEDNGNEETTRSGLFMEAVRIIKEMRKATNGKYPKFAVWENVPGAFSSNKGEDFRTVCEELIKIVEPGAVMPAVPKNGWPYADVYCGEGWSLAYRVYDAQYWGVPQRRRRIYLVLDLAAECAGKISFEREGLRGCFTESRTPWKGTAPDAEGCAGTDDRKGTGFDAYQHHGWRQSEIMGTLTAGSCNGVRGDTPLVCEPVPIHDQATRFTGKRGSNQDGKGNGLGVGNPGDPMNTLTGGDRHAVCCTEIQPICMAHGQANAEILKDKSPCLNCNHEQPILAMPASFYPQMKAESNCFRQEGICNTIVNGTNPGFQNGVVVFDKEVYQSGENATGGHYISDGGPAPTLRTTGQPPGVCVSFIVRRLTPTECARLQGFADRWAVPVSKDDFTDEEYAFWLDIRNTHAEINGKATKQYTKDQMLTWYNKLHTDSSEYKLWGNGIALPTALYVMQGISDVINQ